MEQQEAQEWTETQRRETTDRHCNVGALLFQKWMMNCEPGMRLHMDIKNRTHLRLWNWDTIDALICFLSYDLGISDILRQAPSDLKLNILLAHRIKMLTTGCLSESSSVAAFEELDIVQLQIS